MKNRIKVLLVIAFLFPIGKTSFINAQTWIQKGLDLDGVAENDKFGRSVSLSADGNTVAIGGYANAGNESFSGHTSIFEWTGSEWLQKGSDIEGEADVDLSGHSVSLSADGNIIAIGAILNDDGGENSGHVRIYEWNGSSWIQKGMDIDGEAPDDLSGYSVDLSSDGSIVAIGSPRNGGSFFEAGLVRIYEWSGSDWAQKGMDLEGEDGGDNSGWAVGLSSDGNTVAIGAFVNNGNGINSGQVRIYEWIDTVWIQKGIDIDGENKDDQSGWSVSLSSDGNTVAMGAMHADPNGFNSSGHVRIFNWNGSSWIQKGQNINGEASGDFSGHSVSLSSDGNIVAIGAILNSGSDVNAGHVRIYEWIGSAWVQIGMDIDGEAISDWSGWSVNLSSDGNTVVVGALENDGNGTDSGHARIYINSPTTGIYAADELFNSVSIYPNPNDGLVNIDLGNLKEVSVKIYDVSGRLIYNKKNIKTTIHQIELNEVRGVYFIELSSQGKKRTFELIRK